MKIAVIFDSKFGNTQLLAEKIGSDLKKQNARVFHLADVEEDTLKTTDLIFLGTPTHGGQATPNMNVFISKLVGKNNTWKIACFDTRFSPKNVGFGLKLLMTVIGYASPKMSKALAKATAITVLGEEGLIVNDKKGPLANGELERASRWAQEMVNKAK